MRIPDLNERGTIETMRLGIGGWLAGWSKDSLSWVSRLFAKVTNVHNNSLMHELSTDPFWPHLFGEIFVGENVVKFVLLFLLQRKTTTTKTTKYFGPSRIYVIGGMQTETLGGEGERTTRNGLETPTHFNYNLQDCLDKFTRSFCV